MLRALFAIASFLLSFAVVVNNSSPMLTTSGAIMDCADSTYTYIASESRWIAVCVSYGSCQAPVPLGCTQMPDLCGFRFDHNVSIFSSPDLSSGSWQFERLAFSHTERPYGILYRPHVVYNAATNLWVLWANILDRGVFQGYFAATAKEITGPYSVVVPAVNVSRANCGDFDLFVDNDGAGYVIYTCGHIMGIDALSEDYLSSTGRTSALFPTYFVEAPVMFRRGATYFALFGSCCCFCRQGSGAMVHTATSALGPWTLVNSSSLPDGDVVCARPATSSQSGSALPSPTDTPDQGCAYQGAGAPRADNVSTARSQQNSLIHLADGRIIWTGNRWGQSPDGIKGHEPQAWLPLIFNDAGDIEPIVWKDTFDI